MAAKRTITINPTFKWAVIVNCVLCVVTFVTMIVVFLLAQDDNKFAERLFITCEKVFVMTAGAFIGLLGGRAARP